MLLEVAVNPKQNHFSFHNSVIQLATMQKSGTFNLSFLQSTVYIWLIENRIKFIWQLSVYTYNNKFVYKKKLLNMKHEHEIIILCTLGKEWIRITLLDYAKFLWIYGIHYWHVKYTKRHALSWFFCVKVLLITNDQQSSLWTVIITGMEYVILVHDTGSYQRVPGLQWFLS